MLRVRGVKPPSRCDPSARVRRRFTTAEQPRQSSASSNAASEELHHPEPFGPKRPPPRDIPRAADRSAADYALEEDMKVWKQLWERPRMQEAELRTVEGHHRAHAEDVIAGMRRSAPRLAKSKAPHIPEPPPVPPPKLRTGRKSITLAQKNQQAVFDKQQSDKDYEIITGRIPPNRPNGPIFEDFFDGTYLGYERYNQWKEVYHKVVTEHGKPKAEQFWRAYINAKAKAQLEEEEAAAKIAELDAKAAAGKPAAVIGGAPGSTPQSAPAASAKPIAKPAAPESKAEGSAKPSASPGAKPGAKAEEKGGKDSGEQKPGAKGAEEAGPDGKPSAPKGDKDKQSKEGGDGKGSGEKPAGEKPGAKPGGKPGGKPEAKKELSWSDINKRDFDPADEVLAFQPDGTVDEEAKKWPGMPREFHQWVEDVKKNIIDSKDQPAELKEAIKSLASESFKMQEGERVNPALVDQELGKVIESRAQQQVGGIDNPVEQINRDTQRNIADALRQREGISLSGEQKELHEEIKMAQDKVYEYVNDWSLRPIRFWWEKLIAAPVRFGALIFAVPVRIYRSLRYGNKAVQEGQEKVWTMPDTGQFGPLRYLAYQVLRQAQLQQREARYLEEQGLRRAADETAPLATLTDSETIQVALLRHSSYDRQLTATPVLRPLHVAAISLAVSLERLQERTAKPELKLPETPAEIKGRNAWQVIWMSMIPDQESIPAPIRTGDWWHPSGYTGHETMTSSSFQVDDEEAETKAETKPAATSASVGAEPPSGIHDVKPAADPLAALHAAATAPLEDDALLKDAAKAPASAGAAKLAAVDAIKAEALAADAKAAAAGAVPPTPGADAKPAAAGAPDNLAAASAPPPSGPAGAAGAKPAPQKPDASVVLYQPQSTYEMGDHTLNSLPLFGGKRVYESWPGFLYRTFTDWAGAELGVPGGVRFFTYLSLRYDMDSPERIWAEEEDWRRYRLSMPWGTKWMNRLLYWEQMRILPRPEVHWRDFNNVLWMRGVDVCKRYPSLGTNFFDIRQRLKPVLTEYFRAMHLLDPEMLSKVATPQHVDHMFRTKEEVEVEMPPPSGPILHVMNQTLIRRIFKISVKSLAIWNDIVLISTSCVVRTRPWMRNMETGKTLYGGPKRRAVYKYFVKLAGFPHPEKPGEISWKIVDTELFRGKTRRTRRRKIRRFRKTKYRRFQ